MTTSFLLRDMHVLCNNLNKTNQTKEKISLLQSLTNPFLIKLLIYTYDPSIVFNVTSKNIKKFISLENKDCNHDQQQQEQQQQQQLDDDSHDVFYILNQLKESKWTGHNALKKLSLFLKNKDPDEISVFYNVIDKNLKIRVSLATLQKVFPQSFEDFPVVLANTFSLDKQLIDESDRWFISRKLDGIRCLVLISLENNSVEIYSRNKKPIHTLDLLKKELMNAIQRDVFSSFGYSSLVLDGEIIDDFQKDNFKKVMENVSKKNHTMDEFEYRIFDCIPYSQFKKNNDLKTADIFSVRYDKIKKILQEGFKYCKILEQHVYTKESFDQLQQIAYDHSWEGLMLRKDCVYEENEPINS